MEWKAQLLLEIRRRILGESIPRIYRCLKMLEEEDIWHRPNEASNSVGNLVLHLCGNARQWVVSTLGQAPDERNRAAEFAEQGPLPTPQLREMLRVLSEQLEEVLGALSEEDLLRTYRVQGFQETGIGILIHVAEHFSYHVGQITYFVKARQNRSTGYYEGLDLEVTGR